MSTKKIQLLAQLLVIFTAFVLVVPAFAQENTEESEGSRSRNANHDPNASNGVSSLTIPATGPAKLTPKWGVDAYMETDASPEGNSNLGVPTGSTYIQNFVQLDYFLKPDTMLYLRPTWNTVISPDSVKQTLVATPGKSVTKVGDTVIGLTKGKLLTWGNEGASLTGFVRFYAPTAEIDRTTGQQGEFLFRENIEQPINKWLTLWFDTKVWWAIQSQNAYPNPADPTLMKANFDKELNPYGTAIFRLGQNFKLYQAVGLDYVWMRGQYAPGAIAPAGYTMTFFDTSIGTNLIPKVDLRLGFNDEPTMNVAARPKFANATEYYYYLWAILSI